MINLESELKAIIRNSPNIMTILKACRQANLPQWRLTSGAIYGTIFNHITGRDYDYGIKDYDIIYFDPDLSYEAEDVFIKNIAAILPQNLRDLAEVRNQARVHLWFKQKFGRDYNQLFSTDESLNSYLCFTHAVAIRLENDDEISIAAPFGLEDIFKLELRFNPQNGAYDKFLEKSEAIKARWPEVKIIKI